MSTAVAASEAPQPPRLSTISRMVNTFIAPSQTFTDLKHYTTWTTWIAPWLVTAIFSWMFVAVMAQKIGFEQVSENQIKMAGKRAEQLEKLPPEQRARQMALSVTITKVISFAVPFFGLIFFVIVAAVLMATFNFGVGAEVPFKVALAVVFYAGLPGIVRSLLGIISMLAGVDPEGFIVQNPVATNPAYFMNPADSPVLYSLASSLDVVILWMLVLTALGFSCVSKMNKGTTMGVVFGWYILVTLVGAGFAAVFR
ncbi:MAG TPA: YIP1 family protein [Terriglobales bacterium]|nr:YIP1 family protein [Terriglobales bacterium]